MLRIATGLASPGGARGRLSAFIFHRVLPHPDPLQPGEPSAAEFDDILGWIRNQFNVLPPLDACERLYSGTLPSRAAIVTFDDGYKDNHDIALPLLEKHGVSAVFFIATGYLNDGMMFNDRVIEAVRSSARTQFDARFLELGFVQLESDSDRRSAIAILLRAIKAFEPERRIRAVEQIEEACRSSPVKTLMMTDEQVSTLHRRGMEIGGHTRWHPILCTIDDEAARKEIESGRDDIVERFRVTPRLFAYPNGRPGIDFAVRHRDLVEKAGFSFAFSTAPGMSDSNVDPYQLRRFTPWARDRVRFQLQALRARFLIP